MRVSVLAVAGFALTLAACQTSVQGFTRRHPRWPTVRESLGKVAVVTPWVHWRSPEREAKVGETQRLAEEAFDRLPGATVVDAGPLLSRIRPEAPDAPISDHQIIEAARAIDLDTVCIMSIIEYGGSVEFYVGITLPPIGWAINTRIAFTMRVLDVKRGDLLVWSVISYAARRPLMFRTRSRLPEDLASELDIALAPEYPG